MTPVVATSKLMVVGTAMMSVDVIVVLIVVVDTATPRSSITLAKASEAKASVPRRDSLR